MSSTRCSRLEQVRLRRHQQLKGFYQKFLLEGRSWRGLIWDILMIWIFFPFLLYVIYIIKILNRVFSVSVIHLELFLGLSCWLDNSDFLCSSLKKKVILRAILMGNCLITNLSSLRSYQKGSKEDEIQWYCGLGFFFPLYLADKNNSFCVQRRWNLHLLSFRRLPYIPGSRFFQWLLSHLFFPLCHSRITYSLDRQWIFT